VWRETWWDVASNCEVERTAAAAYFTFGRTSRGRRCSRSTAIRYVRHADFDVDAGLEAGVERGARAQRDVNVAQLPVAALWSRT